MTELHHKCHPLGLGWILVPLPNACRVLPPPLALRRVSEKGGRVGGGWWRWTIKYAREKDLKSTSISWSQLTFKTHGRVGVSWFFRLKFFEGIGFWVLGPLCRFGVDRGVPLTYWNWRDDSHHQFQLHHPTLKKLNGKSSIFPKIISEEKIS